MHSSRSSLMVNMCISQKDRQIVEYLDIPTYESTKLTTAEERDIILEGYSNLFFDCGNSSSQKNIDAQNQTVSSSTKKFDRQNVYYTRNSAKKNLVEAIHQNLKVSDENTVSCSADSVYEDSSDDYLPSDTSSDSEEEPNQSKQIQSFLKKTHNVKKKISTNAKKQNTDNKGKEINAKIEKLITYSKTKKTGLGKRIRDKSHCCYICDKVLLNNMARHFERMHSADTDVAKILALPKGSRSRREAFENLIRVGDFYYNCNILSIQDGELILVRRPDEIKPFSYSDFGPCPHCLGFMSKKYLWHHIKFNCSVKKQKSTTSGLSSKGPISESSALIFQCSGFNVSQHFSENIIAQLRSDNIGNMCKEDELILNIGNFQFEKYGTSQSEMIRQSMRQLGKLKKAIIEISNMNQPLKEFISAEHFDHLVDATKLISGGNFNVSRKRQEFETPSLALKVGHLIKKCIAIERGQAIRKGNLKRNKDLELLSSLLDMEWATKVSSSALATMYKRKMNEQQLLPLTSDLQKLSLHLKEQIEKLTPIVQHSCNNSVWGKLASVILCKIILFNKRRSGEASRMTLENYSTRPCWNNQCTEELKKSLTPLELKLADTLTSLDILIAKRMEGGIIPNNHYIFARSQGSELYLRGHDCLRKECNEACLTSVENITSTKLRKYTATVCQIFNLKENELDWLARHLGHDIRVHRDFYRLHESAIEVTKISRMLMAVDRGEAHNFIGKKLDEIKINDLPEIDLESDNEQNMNVESDREETGDEHLVSNEIITRKLPKTIVSDINSKTKVICKRKLWTSEEKNCVLTHFRRLIKKNSLPGKKECEDCISKYPILKERKWSDIKFCVKNHIFTINKQKQ